MSTAADHAAKKTTGWVGFIWFAATMMLLSGVFSIIWGIVAIVRDEVFVRGPKGNAINLDYTQWGWIHVVVGIVVVLAGSALFTGSLLAGIVAIFLAMLSAVANLLVLGSYPVWSVLVITLDVLVIWAVTMHGQELRR